MTTAASQIDEVYVIDSAFMAMAIALLRPTEPIHCIYELKRGLDDVHSFVETADMLLANVTVASKKEVSVPSPYFRPSGWKRLIFERKFRGEIHAKVDVRQRFVGPKTSAIMSVVPAGNKTYIDHGTGDYNVRTCQRGDAKALQRRLTYLTKVLLGFSNHYVLPGATGYTMCLMAGDSYRHLDYRNLVVNQPLQVALQELKDLAVDGKPALVLPTHPWHSKEGIDGNLVPLDDLNMAMIQQHCRTDEPIFIKWHPSLFLATAIKSRLMDRLRQVGYTAVDVDTHVLPAYRGHIPAEVIVKHCGVGKIVAEQSSLLFNLAHVREIEKANSALLFDRVLQRKGWVLGFYERLNAVLPEPLPIG
jgi:hypothetical protein